MPLRTESNSRRSSKTSNKSRVSGRRISSDPLAPGSQNRARTGIASPNHGPERGRPRALAPEGVDPEGLTDEQHDNGDGDRQDEREHDGEDEVEPSRPRHAPGGWGEYAGR